MQASPRQRVQDDKELALHVMAEKGLDTGDRVFAHATAHRMIHAAWRLNERAEGQGRANLGVALTERPDASRVRLLPQTR
jgi:hypothetical protein